LRLDIDIYFANIIVNPEGILQVATKLETKRKPNVKVLKQNDDNMPATNKFIFFNLTPFFFSMC
jgi:hypothetical protein